jgi:hypothetical protein
MEPKELLPEFLKLCTDWLYNDKDSIVSKTDCRTWLDQPENEEYFRTFTYAANDIIEVVRKFREGK